MKTIIFILTIFILVSCCNHQTKKTVETTNYYYIKYDWSNPTCVVIDTINAFVEHRQNIYNLKFLFHRDSSTDTITYRINELDKSKPEYLINNVKSNFDIMLYEKSREYCISYVSKNHLTIREYFIVYKYLRNPHSIDGDELVFWTPRIGIILKRQGSWKIFEKLQTNNDSINRCINVLTDLIYNDDRFYKKTLDSFEPMYKLEERDK